jgi:CheY-like chemotaxis protein
MRILVVDDDLSVVDTLGVLLRQLGHESVGVTNGYDALDRFRRGRYDLVVVDLIMPEMNGLELIRHLRVIDHNARIVVLTGTTLDLADALGGAGIRLVRKPIGTPDDVAGLITA